MDFKKFEGHSFNDIINEIDEDELILFEKNQDIRLKNEIDKKKYFKQEEK